jgi:hypothetical protein
MAAFSDTSKGVESLVHAGVNISQIGINSLKYFSGNKHKPIFPI